MAGALVPLPDLELDLPVAAFPRPIACPVDERLADALVPVIRRDPDVIEERVRLRRQEPALAEDDAAGRPPPCRLLSRPPLATQNLYGARPVQHTVPPSRCVRCGAVSRDYLCASCIDYLIAYHPLWLNPALLPGPSLLDLVAPRESPLVASDLSTIEWESPRADPSAADAVQLIHLLGLDGPIAPTLSVGDADLLH